MTAIGNNDSIINQIDCNISYITESFDTYDELTRLTEKRMDVQETKVAKITPISVDETFSVLYHLS